MRKILPLLFTVVLIASCARKTVPNTSTNSTVNTPPSTPPNSPITTNIDSANAAPLPLLPVTTTRVASVNAMIVIDGNGRIITPKDKLPVEENLHPDYSTIARAFTPAQKANLTLRYKTIPPKIIYAPEVFTSKSLKGTYIIYKKKFWYWKKADGLFYLDETYYK